MTIIKKITATGTYLGKLPVLRKGKPIESCRFDGDDLETTQHFELYLSQELVVTFHFFFKSDPNRSKKNQYQIRGMAVLENQRGNNFGKTPIICVEKECKNQCIDLIWFNARIESSGFHKKKGILQNRNFF